MVETKLDTERMPRLRKPKAPVLGVSTLEGVDMMVVDVGVDALRAGESGAGCVGRGAGGGRSSRERWAYRRRGAHFYGPVPDALARVQ